MRFSIAVRLQRLAHALRQRSRTLAWPVSALYRLFSLFLLSIDIPVSTKIGRNLRIYHGFGVVIHPNAVLGDNVTLRHSVTIGSVESGADAPAPRIGNGVDIGVGAILLGDIEVGDGCKIGAGAIVVKSVPAGKTCKARAAEWL